VRSDELIFVFSGLAIVFAEAPEETDSANPDRPGPSSPSIHFTFPNGILVAWDELCPIWEAEPDSVKNAGRNITG
jgi:hypothetical protein